MIKDKIVNYGTDVNLKRINAGMFKTLASGEPIEARSPYGKPFTMTGYAKFIFNVNRLDNANIEHTHGFFRRLLIIPFNVTIPTEKQDKNLHHKILKNRAGVLNWIIQGVDSVIKNEGIFISTECKQFKSKFIQETDSVAMFIESADYKPSESGYTLLFNLHIEYKAFCDDDGYKALGKKNFSKRLEALKCKKVKKDGNKDAFLIEPINSY